MLSKVLFAFLFPLLAFAANDTTWVYSHTCTQQFIEGSGVTENSIACAAANQTLGLFEAEYTYYLFADSHGRTNFHHLGEKHLYPTFCNISGLERYVCNANSLKKEFGLSPTSTGKFKTAISLTSSPAGDSSLFGFAALTDISGRCPDGTLAMRAIRADLPSIPHSNFINNNGSKNGIKLQKAPFHSESFFISHIAGSRACDTANNECYLPDGKAELYVTAPYWEQYPVVCVIPPEKD
jgi:hypothetical protein